MQVAGGFTPASPVVLPITLVEVSFKLRLLGFVYPSSRFYRVLQCAPISNWQLLAPTCFHLRASISSLSYETSRVVMLPVPTVMWSTSTLTGAGGTGCNSGYGGSVGGNGGGRDALISILVRYVISIKRGIGSYACYKVVMHIIWATRLSESLVSPKDR